MNIPIYIVRHGETDMNIPGQEKVVGWLDPHLNQVGVEQAENLANKLRDIKINTILSSDLARTQQTADIINQHHDKPIIVVPSLRPWNVGTYQGKYKDDMQNFLNFYAINSALVPKGGESFDAFKQRTLAPIQQIITMNDRGDTNAYLISTHNNNIAIINAWKMSGFPTDLNKIDPKDYLTSNFQTGTVLTL